MNLIKNTKGYSLIELLIASVVGAVVMGALGMSLVQFNRWSSLLSSKGDTLGNAARSLSSISYVGRSAVGCVKEPNMKQGNKVVGIILRCNVEFTTNVPQQAAFIYYDPDLEINGITGSTPKLLIYQKEGINQWVRNVSSFTVCTGEEIKNNNCSISNAVSLPVSVNLAGFFKYEVSFLHNSGETFSGQGAFTTRNSRNVNGLEYLYQPQGAM